MSDTIPVGFVENTVDVEFQNRFNVGESHALTWGLVQSSPHHTKVNGFIIAGKDRKFVWADATIDGDSVVVFNTEVKAPVAVRYAWSNNPECNLYNKEQLPASLFRTDDWLDKPSAKQATEPEP